MGSVEKLYFYSLLRRDLGGSKEKVCARMRKASPYSRCLIHFSDGETVVGVVFAQGYCCQWNPDRTSQRDGLGAA